MGYVEIACHSYDAIAGEFLALADEYRRISTSLADVGRRCEEAGIRRDQVLDIVFTHVVSYIDEGAAQMRYVAQRLAGCAEGDSIDPMALDSAPAKSLTEKTEQTALSSESISKAHGSALDPEDAQPSEKASESRKTALDLEDAQPSESVSGALRDSAVALEIAMNRALDLAEKVGDANLVGDTHPFGHTIQGICMPYLSLAAERLEGLGAPGLPSA